MKHPFNKKRFWLVVGIVAILDVLILFLVFQWKYIFPSTEVSELYTKYANTEGVEASFVRISASMIPFLLMLRCWRLSQIADGIHSLVIF